MKAIPLMAAQHYNWTAAHSMHGEQVYFATQDFDGRPATSTAPRVLVLGPEVSAKIANLTGLRAMQVGCASWCQQAPYRIPRHSPPGLRMLPSLKYAPCINPV